MITFNLNLHKKSNTMKKQFFTLALIIALPFFSWAQGCITVFSEDGDRFYLVLNGVRQNNAPQTNVRVDGLTSDYYQAKIIFENKSKPEISKNIPVRDPGNNQFAEMTYKIKSGKDGMPKLRYFSATPVPENYVAPPDMYVVHFGAPAMGGTVTETTQTTTVTHGNADGASLNVNAAGVNMNINVRGDDQGGMGGVNMNLNVNDGSTRTGAVTHSTTTTTYTTTNTNTNTQQNTGTVQPRGTRCSWAMDASTFNSVKQTVNSASFEDTKLSTAKSALAKNCVNTDQVIAICKMFSFEESKLDFAKFAYAKCVDQNNYFKVATIFNFDASKTELNEFIGQ
jgi:hypothetical protein